MAKKVLNRNLAWPKLTVGTASLQPQRLPALPPVVQWSSCLLGAGMHSHGLGTGEALPPGAGRGP
jgi:hypothetical protein